MALTTRPRGPLDQPLKEALCSSASSCTCLLLPGYYLSLIRGFILPRQWTTKALIRLRRWARWSAPLLFAYGINRFSHDMAHFKTGSSLKHDGKTIERYLGFVLKTHYRSSWGKKNNQSGIQIHDPRDDSSYIVQVTNCISWTVIDIHSLQDGMYIVYLVCTYNACAKWISIYTLAVI